MVSKTVAGFYRNSDDKSAVARWFGAALSVRRRVLFSSGKSNSLRSDIFFRQKRAPTP